MIVAILNSDCLFSLFYYWLSISDLKSFHISVCNQTFRKIVTNLLTISTIKRPSAIYKCSSNVAVPLKIKSVFMKLDVTRLCFKIGENYTKNIFTKQCELLTWFFNNKPPSINLTCFDKNISVYQLLRPVRVINTPNQKE